MKAIQITFDERLLARLDATDEVKKRGRSAVMRHAVEEYLLRHRRMSVAERYRTAYSGEDGLGAEYEGWDEEGEWPAE